MPGKLLDTLRAALQDHLARRRYVGRHRADQRAATRYVASVPVRPAPTPRAPAVVPQASATDDRLRAVVELPTR